MTLGLTGRRLELLNNLKGELPSETNVKFMDISKPYDTMEILNNLIKEMGNVDLIVVSAGTGHINHDLKWELEQETINTNILGVTAIINIAMQYFLKEKRGHLAVISSVASLRGSAECPAYNASKSYLSNYTDAEPITVSVYLTGYRLCFIGRIDRLFYYFLLDISTSFSSAL